MSLYPDELVQPLHNDFIWVYLDVDKSENKQVAGQFKVNGIPHIQVVDSTGQALGNQVGSMKPVQFVDFLQKMGQATASSN